MKIKINTNVLLYTLYIFQFIPMALSMNPTYQIIWLYTKACLGIMGLIALPFVLKRHGKLLFALFCFCASFYIAYILEKTYGIESFLIHFYPLGFFCMLVYFYEKDSDSLVNSFFTIANCICFLYGIYLVIFVILLKPLNMILVSNENGMQTLMLFVIGASLLHDNYYNKNRRINIHNIVVIIIASVAIIVSTSATGILSLLVGILTLVFYKKIGYRIPIIFYGIVFSMIVVMNSTNNGVVSFILGIFSKSETFTNRAWRWKFALQLFREHPFRGTSRATTELSRIYTGTEMSFFNPHNAILDILVCAGLIGCVCLIYLVFRACKKSKNSIINNQYWIVVLSMSLVTGLMESNLAPSNFVFNIFLIMTLLIFDKNVKEEVK